MQVSSSVPNRYYTPYQTNTSVKYFAGFSQTEDGKVIPNKTTENPGFAEFVDYQEFHKAWMSQGAETAFSYTKNEGFNAEKNSISLVPGMSVRLSNGFRLSITDYMVQAIGDYKDNEAAKESAAIAGALSHLIKVANGQIPMNLFYSKNQDSSAYAKIGLEAFGIDTSRAFTINGRTFHFDSEEQIRLWSGQKTNLEYQINVNDNGLTEVINDSEGYKARISQSATRVATADGDGKNIGVMAIGNQAYLAQYSENSTPSKPIVKVGNYEVSVNDVDPENATEIEMFALMSHLEKTGQSKNEGMSSFSKMRSYSQQAERNGFCDGIADTKEAWNSKRNWTEIIENARQTYAKSLIPEVYKLTEKCDDLLNAMQNWIENTRKEIEEPIDFSRFAPNAPEEVRQAFMEAASEAGYSEGERIDYISQVLVHQVENRQNGVANYTDVFGGSIASALQAAREILFDLENPLMPVSQRGENEAKYIEQEKEFYRAFIEKLDGLADMSADDTEELVDYATVEKSLSGRYAAASTQENPIVEVTLQIGEETVTQEININEVNPRKATQLQMYAFFYHQDMVSGNVGANTYEKFASYVENAEQNGHFEGNQGQEEFIEKEHDWQKVIISMWEDYSDAGLYSHMQECISLNETMEKASIRFVDFDNITLINRTSEVSLTYEGPMIPASIHVAWFEAAGAMENTDRFGHLSRVLYRRIEKALEGVQDEIGAIDAAIEAVKQALQDLEDTPSAEIAKDADTKKEMQEVRSYYEAFIQNLEALKENDSTETEGVTGEATEDFTVIYQEFIAVYMEQIFVKIQNGDTEPTYQIGSQSFTEKEWEEFLDKFDTIEEAIQELMKEEQARKEAEKVEEETEFTLDEGSQLTAESTTCTYPSSDPKREPAQYITMYTPEGISCKKIGETEFMWTLPFENKEDYNKVLGFLDNFPSDWNMRFAASKKFWTDFLDDKIDMDEFMEFMEGTNKGVPDYSVTEGDSMYIDESKMQWAEYTNPPGSRFYSAEEMHQMQLELIKKNEEALTKFTDWDAYEENYKKNHPEYNGEKICCEYPGGPLYTVKEMAELQYRKMLDEMGITEEEMERRREVWRKNMGY